jgi:DNA invertase Pin-like site-specific DNA recombinase
MKRIAIYARTSTIDKQSPEMQIRELREYAQARGWEIYDIYQDHGYSGRNTNQPMFQKLVRDSMERKFELVLVWKLDCWARSLKEIVMTLQELSDYGVEFCSLKDSIDLSTNQGKLMLHIIAAFAQFEADIIRERVRAGVAHARSKGKKLGRPAELDSTKIQELRLQGLSLSKIDAALGCTKSAVSKSLRKLALQVAETTQH